MRNFYAYVYISGVGTPEAVHITSTTCTQAGGANGSITFTAANTHGSGYAIGSASQGVQEAINAASYPVDYSGYGQNWESSHPSRAIHLASAGEISAPYMKIDCAGSYVTCPMADTCLFVGTVANPTYVWNVTVKNFTGQAGCNNCNFPMIEDAAQDTHFMTYTDRAKSTGYKYHWQFLRLFDSGGNDQATVIDSLDPPALVGSIATRLFAQWRYSAKVAAATQGSSSSRTAT